MSDFKVIYISKDHPAPFMYAETVKNFFGDPAIDARVVTLADKPQYDVEVLVRDIFAFNTDTAERTELGARAIDFAIRRAAEFEPAETNFANRVIREVAWRNRLLDEVEAAKLGRRP